MVSIFPTKYEYRHLKALVEYGNLSNSSSTSQVSSSNSSTVSNSTVTSNAGIANGGINSISTMATPISNNKSKKSKKKKKTTLLTQVKLPPPGPLLNQVISTISNTAIDGICKFSELSSNVVKLYYNGKDSSTQHTATLNELTKSITKSIYSTAASTITSKPDNNQLVKVIDLKNDKVMGIFKPPGGVSNVSLSPYDLQLVHSNLRGDLIFMWDLYKLPLEVSLIGKFIRGKTSAKIKDIFWFINNSTSQNSPTAKGNNYGFGCLTKSTGSIHWFNVNYLSGSLNSNLPNSLGKTHKLISNGSKHDHKHSLSKDTSSFVSPRSSSSDDFSDDWILSSMKAIKFLTLPDKSNSMNSSCSPNAVNQLAIIDSKNQLRLISPLNGLSLFRYQLPNTPVSKEFVPVYNRVFGLTRTAMVPTFNPNLAILNELNGTKKKTVLINPLSRTEIETCGPYSNLYRNKNIEFSTFDYHHEGDLKEFLYNYEMFGNEISHKVIHFGNKGEVNQKNEVIDTGIILDQEVSEEEIDDVETVIGDESVSKKQN